MPWTAKSFRVRHNKGVTGQQAARAAKVANAVLKRTGNEGQAVRVANAAVKRGR